MFVNFLARSDKFKYLTFGIGIRARREFAPNSSSPLPPVKFITPKQATDRGLPPTGWYNFVYQTSLVYS